MSHKIVPPRYYFINFLVIGALMAATVMAAKMPVFHISDNPNGAMLLVALVIAVLKASCIVAIFMGAFFSTKLVRLLSVVGFAWLIIFFLFTLTDYVNPLEDFGTPYLDVHNPGVPPLQGGQEFSVTGRELTPPSGGHYAPPPNLHGGEHGEAGAHGAEAAAETEPPEQVVENLLNEAEAPSTINHPRGPRP